MIEWREDDPRESVMKRATIAICEIKQFVQEWTKP